MLFTSILIRFLYPDKENPKFVCELLQSAKANVVIPHETRSIVKSQVIFKHEITRHLLPKEKKDDIVQRHQCRRSPSRKH